MNFQVNSFKSVELWLWRFFRVQLDRVDEQFYPQREETSSGNFFYDLRAAACVERITVAAACGECNKLQRS
jgi:hypothetical protein